jgi:hypothetical protein
MARRLKSYQTSSGFFDLAVAAPSMKAAAEAWGSRTNVFTQGFAKETRDPAVVVATMAKPGVVLRRPVGSNGPFTEHAELPKDLPVEKLKERPAKTTHKEPPPRKPDTKAVRSAALAFEREQKLRWSGNAASKRLQRQEGRSNRPGGSTRPRSKRSKKIELHSTNGRKWRMRDGRSRRRSWRQLCVERVTKSRRC